MTKLTEQQKQIGQAYSARAMAAIHEPEIYDQVMAEFEEWKKQEGINL